MIISPETQKALVNLVMNATNSTTSPSASPQANDPDGFSPTNNIVMYGIFAIGFTLAAVCCWTHKHKNDNTTATTASIINNPGMSQTANQGNLGSGNTNVSINNSDSKYSDPTQRTM